MPLLSLLFTIKKFCGENIMYCAQALYYACLCVSCFLLSSISVAKPLSILSLLNSDLDQYNNRNRGNYFSDQSQYGPDDSDLSLPSQPPETPEQKESRVLYYKVPQSSEVGAELFDGNDNNNAYVYETYGPFPEEQVMDWWRAGYFDSSLLVSDDLAAQFIPMTTFLDGGFSPPPPPPPIAATRPSEEGQENQIEEILDYGEAIAVSDESPDWATKKKGTRKKSPSVLKKIAGLGRRAKQASLAFLQDTLTSPTSPTSSGQSDQDYSSSAQSERLEEDDRLALPQHRQPVSPQSNVRGP